MLELDVRSDDSVRCCVAEVLVRAGEIYLLGHTPTAAIIRSADGPGEFLN